MYFVNVMIQIPHCTVQNLVEGIDVPAIEAKIAEYQKENAELIMINQARKVFFFSLVFAIMNSELIM